MNEKISKRSAQDTRADNFIHLNEAVYRVARKAKIVLDSNLGGLQDLSRCSTHTGYEPSCCHSAGNSNCNSPINVRRQQDEEEKGLAFGHTTPFSSRYGSTC